MSGPEVKIAGTIRDADLKVNPATGRIHFEDPELVLVGCREASPYAAGRSTRYGGCDVELRVRLAEILDVDAVELARRALDAFAAAAERHEWRRVENLQVEILNVEAVRS